MVHAQPQLLLQNPSTLGSKVDALGPLLGLGPARVRELLVAVPGLLRRSSRAVQQRH
ncbi:hypothetical protein HaLaN_01238, partial [Haematococcus lacustris]